jgi:SP family facilitated glucose transporter-like MFS transporter 3
MILSPLLRESPRWLLMKGQKEAARGVLQELRECEDVDEEMDLIMGASNAHSTNESHGFWYVLSDESMRLPLMVGVGLQMAQQLSGINAVFYYSNSFFAGIITNPMVGTTIVGTVNVISVAIALLLMDTAGRRPLLLFGTCGMLISLIMTTLALLKLFPASCSSLIALVGVNLYVFFFEIGLGPIPWLIVAEMFPARTRATAVSLATNVNWLCNFLVGIFFPIVNASLGGYTMVPFAAVCLVVLVFTYFFVVETKGKSIEEIEEEMKRK